MTVSDFEHITAAAERIALSVQFDCPTFKSLKRVPSSSIGNWHWPRIDTFPTWVSHSSSQQFKELPVKSINYIWPEILKFVAFTFLILLYFTSRYSTFGNLEMKERSITVTKLWVRVKDYDSLGRLLKTSRSICRNLFWSSWIIDNFCKSWKASESSEVMLLSTRIKASVSSGRLDGICGNPLLWQSTMMAPNMA